jgi:hypothetical protein
MYAFRHALTRDAAYASLLRSAVRSATSALRMFWSSSMAVSSARRSRVLAYHFQEAGDFSAALGLDRGRRCRGAA